VAIAASLPQETARLRLRRFRGTDLDLFQAYRCDPAVSRYQGWSAMDDAGAAAFIDAMATARFGVPGEWFQIAVAEKDADELIGDIGVCIRDDGTRTAEIGFSIAPAAQGRGIGTEAVIAILALLFDARDIERVEGITDARNVPSIRLLERIGMRLIRDQDAVYKGEMCMEHVYAIERSPWAATATVNPRNPR